MYPKVHLNLESWYNMGIINMGDNIFQVYGNINLGDKMFFAIWKQQHERQLKRFHKEYNQNFTPSITFDEYAEIIFVGAPHSVEHRMN